MSQYITRNLPVITGVANTNITEGTAVLFAGNGYLYAVTSSFDPWIGVVADFENAVDGVTNSGSVVNVAVRGSGLPVKVRCNGAVTKNSPLIITGSNGQFKSGNLITSGSATQGPDTQKAQFDAYALQAGADNDIITAIVF